MKVKCSSTSTELRARSVGKIRVSAQQMPALLIAGTWLPAL